MWRRGDGKRGQVGEEQARGGDREWVLRVEQV